MDQVRTVTEEESLAEEVVAPMEQVEAGQATEGVAIAKEEETETLVEETAATEGLDVTEAEAVVESERAEAEGLEDAADEALATVGAEAETLEEAIVAEPGEAPAQEEAESHPDEATTLEAEESQTPVGEAVTPGILEAAGQTEEDRASTSEMGELPVEDWDYQRPKRGQVRTGVILAIREQEIIIDVGVKRDGLVPFADMQRMGPEALESLSVGDEVPVYILRPEDQDGNLLVSLFMARQAHAWNRAEELAKSGKVWEETVSGYNKGGVVVPVDEIRGFVPASQLPGFPAGLNQEDRLERLSTFVGETLQVKVIEINRRKRRLILSARSAHRQWRRQQRKKLLEELREGEVRTGTVSSLANFGAFVDLGGADGLVHLSELSWRRVRHPKEVLKVGDKVEVYVLRLDQERNRIGLSLKRLQPEPWALVEDKYELGQLIEGVVTNVVDFGAFAEIEEGVEGLIHVSELTDAQISHPRDVVKKGDLLLLRIIRIDVRRKRLGLSLKRVLESEWAEWAAQIALAEAEKQEAATDAEVAAEPAVEEEVALVAEVEEQPLAEEAESELPEEPALEEVAEAAESQASEELLTEEATALVEEEAESELREEPASEEVAEAAESQVSEELLPEEGTALAEEEAESELPEEPASEEVAEAAESQVSEEPLSEEETALPEAEPAAVAEDSTDEPEAATAPAEDPAMEEGEAVADAQPLGEDVEADAGAPATEEPRGGDVGQEPAAQEVGMDDLPVDAAESTAADA